MQALPIPGDLKEQIAQICQRGGAFLTAKHEERLNTMTIGWGTIGFIWGKPVFMVAVRPSRHTFGILEESLEFTVTIPKDESLKEALAVCGTKSGRDIDKFAECGLVTKAAVEIATPIIVANAWQYECRVIYKQAMGEACILEPTIMERLYQSSYGGLHTLYFGEILAGYET